MLTAVRRTRWMIALLLLLFGQAGAVRAFAAPSCARSHEAAPSQAVAGAAWLAASAPASAAAEHSHAPADELPGASALAAGCVAAALPVAPVSVPPPPSATRLLPSHADAAPPRLHQADLFRPPRAR